MAIVKIVVYSLEPLFPPTLEPGIRKIITSDLLPNPTEVTFEWKDGESPFSDPRKVRVEASVCFNDGDERVYPAFRVRLRDFFLSLAIPVRVEEINEEN